MTAATAAAAPGRSAPDSPSQPRRSSFWFAPLPVGRIAALRLVGYVFVLLDMVWWTPWVRPHREIPAFYQPLAIGRLLHLPVPTPRVVDTVGVLLVLTAVAGIALALGAWRSTLDRLAHGRAISLVGAAVALLYGEWMVIAMSYGKVDHDRFALLVLLAVVATVGPARVGERRSTEAAGWALRCIQVAVVTTYFLAAIAKFRFGGFGWVNGSTLVWAIIRRGTPLGDPLLHVPWLLHITQWGIVAMELGTPSLFVLERVAAGTDLRARWAARFRTFYLWGLVAFHVLTFAAISILFLPHVICLLAFAPLERLPGQVSALQARVGRRPVPATA